MEDPSPEKEMPSESLASSAGEEHFAARLREASEEMESLRKENESLRGGAKRLEEQLKKAQALNVKWRATNAEETHNRRRNSQDLTTKETGVPAPNPNPNPNRN